MKNSTELKNVGISKKSVNVGNPEDSTLHLMLHIRPNKIAGEEKMSHLGELTFSFEL